MDFFDARLRRLRDEAPVGQLLLLAWMAALVWLSLIGVALEQLRWIEWAEAGDGFYQSARGSWSVGAAIFRQTLQAVRPSAMIVLFVAVVHTPALIGLAGIFDRFSIDGRPSRYGGIGSRLRQDYAGTLSCVLLALILALTVQMLPLLALMWIVRDPAVAQILPLLPLPVFVVLMVPVGGLLFNLRPLLSVLLSLLSLVSLLALPVVIRAASMVCTSPLLIVLLIFLLRERIDDLLRHRRSRQTFRRHLEVSTINPADASAHYNLGLLHLEQGDLASAKASFMRAVEIDQREVDAHYQLGRMAREEKRLSEALSHFEQVIAQDPAHAQHEVWREVGQVYYAAGQNTDALAMLDRFLQQRPSDAEAHYWRGMVLERLERRNEAIDEMRQCIEAVRTSPSYKYRHERRWLTLAEKFLRELT
jgi:hypothetical protein